MTKAAQFKAELRKLDDALLAGSSHGKRVPAGRKAKEGSDTIGGYPPA